MSRFLAYLAALLFAGAAHAQVLSNPPVSFPILAPDGNNVDPSFAFAADTDTGIYRVSSNTLAIAGSSQANQTFAPAGQVNRGYVAWGSSGVNSPDVFLLRDAANTLALRNAANAQLFRVYNTYTDALNYERGFVGWAANTFYIGTEAAGTGTSRPVILRTGGTDRWRIETSGNFTAATDNAFDIGASAANRPRNVYVAGSLLAAAQVIVGPNATRIVAPSDGVITLQNNASADFSRLQFGGTTSSFPALKRNGARLESRLADDSAATTFSAASIFTSTTYTVATLPACTAPDQGRRSQVSDATAPTFLGTLTGGGAVVTPVFCNGSAWVAG